MNQHLIKSYLQDLQIICESKNFKQTFNVPKRLSELGLDAEELQERILNIFRADSFKDKNKFFELFEHMNVNEEQPETIEITWHVSHDDFTNEDEEHWQKLVQSALND